MVVIICVFDLYLDGAVVVLGMASAGEGFEVDLQIRVGITVDDTSRVGDNKDTLRKRESEGGEESCISS